jgi:transketolase
MSHRPGGSHLHVPEFLAPYGEAGTSADAAFWRPSVLCRPVTHLAVGEMPGSGTGEELLAWAGIDADHIAAAARKLLGG